MRGSFFAVLAVLAAAALSGCPRNGAERGVDTLAGTTVSLTPSPALRLSLPGSVGATPADVQLDPSAPISIVTDSCIEDPLVSSARATVTDPLGTDEVMPITRLVGLHVGPTRFMAFDAALTHGKPCTVTLGADVLKGLAVHVSPSLREVSFLRSRSKAELLASAEGSADDVQLVELTRDPKHDWPLVPVRVLQGPDELTAVFVLATTPRPSRVFEESARMAGLKPGVEALEGLPLPRDVKLPAELEGLRGFAYDKLELSPGFGVSEGSLELAPGAPPHGVAGALGADVWGRFDATLDLEAGALLLRRPRVLTAGSRVQCDRAGALSEEACYELTQARTPAGVLLTVSMWRALAEGGRLYLDVDGVSAPCRLGVTFPPGDRGRSTQHLLPWGRLFETMPGCAQVLAGATAVKPALFEEGYLTDCPGVCAFAQDLRSGKVSCECQPGAPGFGGEAERRFLELYKRLLEELPKEHDTEPRDPE